MSRIDWVISSCRLLATIGEEFDRTRPFAGVTIGTGIHLEPKTVALILVLARGGAEVVSTGNLSSTQPAAVDYLRAAGIRVIGGPTADPSEHDGFLREVLDARPDLLLDNGGDLFARWLDDPYPALRGGTEETTSGRARLGPLRERLARPILVINDSPIKQFAENEHAVGQSVLESFIRITNRSTNGKRVTVFGYGACGRGVAQNFRAARAIVSVVEIDPVLRLQALLDGFSVPAREAAIAEADVIVTVTGAPNVVGAADTRLFHDDAILLNGGHLPWEIDVNGLVQGRRGHLGGRRHRNAHVRGRTQCPRPDGWPHGQPGGATAARQLGRVDGPRLRAPGSLSRGDRAWRRQRRGVPRAGPEGHRRGGRTSVRDPRR